MRYSDAKKKAVEELKAARIEEAGTDAEYLLLEATGLERSSLFVKLFDEMPETEIGAFEQLVKRRCTHEPLQYIVGSQEFMGFDFMVTPDVLIPRFDTEILAELAIKRSVSAIHSLAAETGEDRRNNIFRILDLCTGSGCVAVSVGLGSRNELIRDKELLSRLDCFSISVTGSDISPAAVSLAKKNLKINRKSVYDREEETHLKCNISFLKSDLFKEISGTYHMITANPPYIVRDEIKELMPEITEHEPHIALDGGDDGMDFYRRICRKAPEYLVPGGRLLMEFDDSQAEPVEEMMLQAGFTGIEIHRDLAGLRRVIEGVFPTDLEN